MTGEFTYCPRCATPLERSREGDRERMRCPSCGYIQYRNPAAAAGVLVREGNAILLVKRRYDPYRGLWVVPSGFIEYDEDVRATAVREAREETGLEIEIDGLFGVESCFDDPRGNAILILFDAHRTGGTLAPGDDAEAARFFPLDALPPIAFEAHRKTLASLTPRPSR